MWNASSTESLVQGSVFPGFSSRADLRPQLTPAPTLVSITSVVTETVHPTLFVTEVMTVGISQLETILSNAGQSQGEKSSGSGQLMQPGTVQTNASQTQTVQLGISMTATQLTEISVPSTAVSTSTTSAQESTTVSVATKITSASSATAETVLGTTTTPTSTQPGLSTLVASLAQAISASLSSQLPSPSPSPLSSLTLSPSPSPAPSPASSPSPESSADAAITSDSNFTNHQPSQGTPRANLGAIVGGTLGGTVFLALALLAFILCFRRRQRRSVKPHSPGRGLLRNSGDSLAALCNRFDQREIQPSYPMGSIPSPRGNTTRLAPAPKSAVATPNQGFVLNTMGLFRDAHQNSFCDPEGSPVSPIINVHPPSPSVSMYSQPSSEGDLKVLEKSDLELPSVYLYNESNTPALASNDTLAPWDDRKMRLSTRSDPFDLEVPPTVLHEWPPLPRPTPWGNRF